MNTKKDKNLTTDEGFSEPKKEKESIQIYFELDLVDNIADFIHVAKKQLPQSKRKRLNRTLIISLVLSEAFNEYSKFGNSSYLWKIFSKWAEE